MSLDLLGGISVRDLLKNNEHVDIADYGGG